MVVGNRMINHTMLFGGATKKALNEARFKKSPLVNAAFSTVCQRRTLAVY
jgi:hypothetical protein